MIILFVILSVIALIGLIYYLFPPIQVIGDSMYPTYSDGEIIFGRRVYLKSKLKVGQVIVYTSPLDDITVIKRIDSITEDFNGHPMFYCLGDNSQCSHDSRDYGYVLSRNLVCKVINPREKIYSRGGENHDEQ